MSLELYAPEEKRHLKTKKIAHRRKYLVCNAISSVFTQPQEHT